MTHVRQTQNAYEILGLSPDAPQHDIHAALRRLAMTYHPDRNHGHKKMVAVRRFQAILDAYEKVKTPELRARYDTTLRTLVMTTVKPLPRAANNDNISGAKPDWFSRCIKTLETVFWPFHDSETR